MENSWKKLPEPLISSVFCNVLARLKNCYKPQKKFEFENIKCSTTIAPVLISVLPSPRSGGLRFFFKEHGKLYEYQTEKSDIDKSILIKG